MRWIALAVFAWLAFLVGRGESVFFDQPARDALHQHASTTLTAIFEAFTFIGAPRVFWPAVVIVLVLGWRHYRSAMVRLGAVMLGAAILEIGLKLAFHRLRPMPFFGLTTPDSYSFPSGHALYAACFYGALAGLATTRQRVVASVAAAFMIFSIGVSRIYLGVHYPSDVLAGWSIGWFWTRSVLEYKPVLEYKR